MSEAATLECRCPVCGAELGDGEHVCWLCVSRLTDPPPKTIAPARPADAENRRTFSLSTMMLLVTAIGIGLALLAAAPGWGILYFVVMGPTLAATSAVAERRSFLGRPLTKWGKFKAFIRSLGAVLLISFTVVVSLGIAFLATCAVILAPLVADRASNAVAFVIAMLVGAALTIAVLVWLTRLCVKRLGRE